MAKTTRRSTTDLLQVGRPRSWSRWADARAIFEEALAAQETPEAFEGVSWPAW